MKENKIPPSQDPNFEEGDKDSDIYNEEGRENLEDSDEITELEEGFIEGYEEGEHEAKCANCKKVLVDEKFIEEELDGEHYRFCSEECANAFEVGKKIKRGR